MSSSWSTKEMLSVFCKVAQLSVKAWGLDHLTDRKRSIRVGLSRFMPTNQKPPSPLGPKTASACPSFFIAFNTCGFVIVGMSLPTMITGPGGAFRKARAILSPRFPFPWPTNLTPCAQRGRWFTILSGVIAMVRFNRGSSFNLRTICDRLFR